jgi:hypothetical protein
VLLVGLGLVLLTRTVARSSRVQRMRADLVEVLGECRARYAAARSAADSAAADAWRPPLGGAARPDDPPCGSYRRRDMLPDGSP